MYTDARILPVTRVSPGCSDVSLVKLLRRALCYAGQHSFHDHRRGGVSVYVRATLNSVDVTQCGFVADLIETCNVELSVSPAPKFNELENSDPV